MNLSVKGKIRVLVYTPLIVILFLASILFIRSYSLYSATKSLSLNISSLNTMSTLVGNLQKERGMSATFLSGGISKTNLSGQRSNTNAVLSKFKRCFIKSCFGQNGNTVSFLSELPQLRALVNRKGSVSSVLTGYTGMIYKLLNLYKVAAEKSQIAEFKTLLTNSIIIEEAKESSGKLRANMSKTLAADLPIGQGTLSTLLKLKAGVDISLTSPALHLDSESKSQISKFYESAHWKDVNKTFSLILSKMSSGGYGRNGGEFFGVISKSVSALGNIVRVQSEVLSAGVEKKFSQVKAELIQLVIFIIIIIFALTMMIIKTSQSISDPLDSMSNSLDSVSEEVNLSSANLSQMGIEITERATSQASAIEQTSASVEELVAMVDSNLEFAELSTEKATKISSISKEGNVSSASLLSAMHEIKQSNESIGNIVGLMNEIAEKTKVIDDIVFQTKLLSFNASVEAERAGEQGRGFAVVAQEVGNLAQMTAKAADEISNIVSKSVDDVNKAIQQNDTKVEQGSSVAETAADIFSSIDKHSEEAALMSDKILSASREQTLGLKQINEAIAQLDKNTQESVITAEEMSDAGKNLDQNSSVLRNEVVKLIDMVKGEA